MESSNLPTIAKRLWHIMQVLYYMFRKNLSKRRLILDTHFLLKRSKLAGKALRNLLATSHRHHHFPTMPDEVEFSCHNTPSHAYNYFFASTKRKSGRRRPNYFNRFDAAEMAVAFQMMNVEDSHVESAAPPELSTPATTMMIRQLRIKDSPFLISENEVMDVDKEADNFIKMFYEELQAQQLISSFSLS